MANQQYYEDRVEFLSILERKRIDKLFAPSAWCKRMSPETVFEEYIQKITEASKKTISPKSGVICDLGIPYGPSENQKIDIFTSESTSEDAPIFVFVHGGYWHLLSRDYYSYIAGPIVQAGGKAIIVGYDLSPTVTLNEIVNEIEQAIRYIVQEARKSRCRGIHLIGHSAGAHLVAMALRQELKQSLADDFESASSMIKSAFLISGVYDLRPITNTKENNHLRLTRESAWANSPLNPDHVLQLSTIWENVQLNVIVAENDAPDFKMQATHYNDVLNQAGVSTKYIDLPELDHFDITDRLDEPDFVLTKEILAQLHLDNTKQN